MKPGYKLLTFINPASGLLSVSEKQVKIGIKEEIFAITKQNFGYSCPSDIFKEGTILSPKEKIKQLGAE